MPAKKKMTQREKAERARIKKELQKEGLLPPDKPRLNRKKFAAEVWEDWLSFGTFEDWMYLSRAISCMVGPDMTEVTSEQVGVLKVMKMAMEMKKFEERIKAEGREKYTIGEMYEAAVKPVIEL